VCGFFVDRFCNSAPNGQRPLGGFKKRVFVGCVATNKNPLEQGAATGGERFAPNGAKQKASTKNPRTLWIFIS